VTRDDAAANPSRGVRFCIGQSLAGGSARRETEINLPHLLVALEIARRTFKRDAPGLQGRTGPSFLDIARFGVVQISGLLSKT
jgi:hypothetical protein